ncbi:hypothetical protein AXG93_3083s1050 [Marchantia polymorpha subsp. ruderalis]|uniref:Uncharacterized protein n=1 Tax=Marchantia polymorpha subsp. ruderalis TaxID=1480154 RepID=A0A176VU03_MARPO|nr:hypothetical protein AXG93_3083s1050 [Marchantia polymorpha subsp. ruderalis]
MIVALESRRTYFFDAKENGNFFLHVGVCAAISTSDKKEGGRGWGRSHLKGELQDVGRQRWHHVVSEEIGIEAGGPQMRILGLTVPLEGTQGIWLEDDDTYAMDEPTLDTRDIQKEAGAFLQGDDSVPKGPSSIETLPIKGEKAPLQEKMQEKILYCWRERMYR